MAPEDRTIKEQVKLPLSVSMEVVLRGIKIRFGRSVVTIMGVVLGIAFLMAILTGQHIKENVAHVDQMQRDLKRRYSFLTAEMGPPAERTVGVLQLGKLNRIEKRFLQILEKNGLAKIQLNSISKSPADPPLEISGILEEVPLSKVADGAKAVIVAGEGKIDKDTLEQLSSGDEGEDVLPVAFSRGSAAVPIDNPGLRSLILEREMKPDELEKLEAERVKQEFRRNWIIIISLFVTVIGISNAMLMSVTERFQEIGTMKCLGALSAFIRSIFLLESSLMGLVGGVLGGLAGGIFALLAYAFSYGFVLIFVAVNPLVLLFYFALCVVAGIVLSILAAIYPANMASRMVPADALRSHI